MMDSITFGSGRLRIAGLLFLPDPGSFKPPYPGVAVCHGIGGCKENQIDFDTYLVQRGYAVLGFDFRGHGASEGELDDHTLDDVSAALDFLVVRPEVAPHRVALRGASMGGLLALQAAIRDERVRAVAAIAPAGERMLADAIESGSIQRLLEREQRQARIDERSFGSWLRSCETRSTIARIAPRALLLIQCKGDELVSWTGTEELFNRAHLPKKLLLLEGGTHHLAQHDSGMHQSTEEWFKTFL